MSGQGEITGIVQDLLVWIRQNETPSGGWYHQKGPGESAVSELPVPATTRQPEPAGISDDDPFSASCSVFVADTLDQIRSRRESGEGAMPEATARNGQDPSSDLAVLRDEVLPCTSCGLHTTRNNAVFGSGSPRAGLVIIGEAPGRDEDIQGEPFVGRSGQLLTKILASIGFTREEVFICNILKCRPPENRDPMPPEVAACEPHLKRQLAILRPRLICCLGRVAAQTLLQTDASLGTLRRSVHFYENIPVLATFHPAYLLRNPAAKRGTWDDVRKLRALHDALGAGGGDGKP